MAGGEGYSIGSVSSSTNVVWSPSALGRCERWHSLRQSGATVWLTGLPASGKSTLAAGVERRLVLAGRVAYRLDGDNLRRGLNGDLGFDAASRTENVRRTAHVAVLLADAGAVAIVSLVSPYARDRAAARSVHEAAGIPFVEVFVDTPLEECERRDRKGLYARARNGEIPDFTGISDPYEAPQAPDVWIPGDGSFTDLGLDAIVGALERLAAGPGGSSSWAVPQSLVWVPEDPACGGRRSPGWVATAPS